MPHRLRACQNHQPLDIVAELANVTRPVMRLENGHGVIADLARADAGLFGNLPHEHVYEERNILTPPDSAGTFTGTTARRW